MSSQGKTVLVGKLEKFSVRWIQYNKIPGYTTPLSYPPPHPKEFKKKKKKISGNKIWRIIILYCICNIII